jgi:hypothetical protein
MNVVFPGDLIVPFLGGALGHMLAWHISGPSQFYTIASVRHIPTRHDRMRHRSRRTVAARYAKRRRILVAIIRGACRARVCATHSRRNLPAAARFPGETSGAAIGARSAGVSNPLLVDPNHCIVGRSRRRAMRAGTSGYRHDRGAVALSLC